MSEKVIRVGTSAGSLSAIPAPDELNYGLQDVSASDAGRVQDANVSMQKNRIAQKRKLSLVWKNRSSSEVAQIMQAFNPEYVWLDYPDSLSGVFEVREFYVGDRSAAFRKIVMGGATYSTLNFNVIER